MTSGHTSPPTRARRLIFPVLSRLTSRTLHESSHETSHEGVHGSANEGMIFVVPEHVSDLPPFHWEIKGRFRKRVVLANVPSFRFSFRGNIRQNHPFGNHPFVNTKKAHWEIKGRFPKGWFWRMYPRSGFRSGGTSAKTTLLETTLLRTPDLFPSSPPPFFDSQKAKLRFRCPYE